MPTLKYWDATQNAYVPIPGMASPSNMVATILNTPTAAASPYTITHNMNTNNVMVQAWDTVTGDLIIVRMHISDANHIQVFFEQNCPNNVNVLVTASAGSLAPAPVVAARMTRSTSQHYTTGWTALTFDTTEYDSHSACAQGTGTYTVPAGQPGDYLVTGVTTANNLPAGQWIDIAVYKNGTLYAMGNQPHTSVASLGIIIQVSTVVRCNAGDTLQVEAVAGVACDSFAVAGGAYQYMTVHRIFPGLQAAGAFLPPQTPPPTGNNFFTDASGQVWASRNGSVWVLAQNMVKARVYRAAALTGTPVPFPFDTVITDPMILVSGGRFTCPIPGDYLVTCQLDYLSTAVGQGMRVDIRKSGATWAYGSDYQSTAASQGLRTRAVEIVSGCAAGDLLDIYPAGSSLNIEAGSDAALRNYMAVQYLHP